MNDISEILRELLDRYSNTPELDQEFERMRREVDGFEADYITWCEDNGYEFQVFRFDDTSVSEFDVQSVPTLVLKENGEVKQILNEE